MLVGANKLRLTNSLNHKKAFPIQSTTEYRVWRRQSDLRKPLTGLTAPIMGICTGIIAIAGSLRATLPQISVGSFCL